MNVYESLKRSLEQAIEYAHGNTANVTVSSLTLCPKCGKIASFNSYFQSYYCTSCGNMFDK